MKPDNSKLESNTGEPAEQSAGSVEDRRKRIRDYRKWLAGSLFGGYDEREPDRDEKIGRIVRAVFVLTASALSVLLYWVCFLDRQIPVALSTGIFLFYLIPVSLVSVIYGWFGGVMCFTTVFAAAVIMSPSNAYFPFFHLIAVYLFSFIRSKKLCRNVWRTLITGVLSGFFMSLAYYVIFILVTEEKFSEVGPTGVLLHLCNLIPQTLIICFFTLWYDTRCSERVKNRLGFADSRQLAFVRMINQSIASGYRSLAGKIFAILLVEAVIMGVAAALFANALIPKLMEQRRNEIAAVQDDGSTETSEDGPPDLPENISPDRTDMNLPGFEIIMDHDEFSGVFESAREHAMHERFAYDDRGISFDLKLIMMLLCAIHPVVYLANFVGQRIIVRPIMTMADVVREYDEDEESRLKVEHNLKALDIHSEDEIEILYGTVNRMVSELNSYIEDIKREQQLKEDLRVAQAASEAKSTFLSSVSHEIRTPINAVLGLDEMILRESDDENIRKYAVDIHNSGKTLLSLINDLLDFSRIEAGKMEIIPIEYELSSTINDLINMVSAKAQDKGLELIVNVDPDVPHLLIGDEIRIKQCILNVLNNAVKYTHKGSVTLTVKSTRVSDEEILLYAGVKDTGIGIREEDISKLFAPFERIEESRNRTIEGTGLGMSIVRQLLDMMGTELKVESVYGEGSDFSFEVSQKVVDWEPMGDFTETYRKSVESMERYRVSFVAPDADILVVDDTPMNLTVIRGLLKDTLVRVDTATSGEECLRRIRDKAYDIIFMDQRMPEMDGTETLHAMKSLDAADNKSINAVVIILTANVVAGARETFIKEGFADYLSKPVDAVKLEKMIAGYLPSDKVLPPGDDPESGEGTADGGINDDNTRSQIGGDEEFMMKLSETEGIDASAGLANCMKEDILKEAVHDFIVSLKTVPDNIEKLWKEGNIREFTVAVHALKSSARLIGALDLSAQAAALEACGDAQDSEGIDASTSQLLNAYRAFGDRLAWFAEDAADDDRPEIDPDSLGEAYGGIREAVDAFDFDTADEIVKMLGDYRIPAEESERYVKICDMVTRLDRDGLLEEI